MAKVAIRRSGIVRSWALSHFPDERGKRPARTNIRSASSFSWIYLRFEDAGFDR